MFYVYHIQSIKYPDRIYVGYTENLEARIATHNAGGSIHTAPHKPWKLIAYHAFEDMLKARRFETYLKTPSGRAFSKKRL
jgi:predicted GIY-YIG superfamily endonuclease